MEKVKRKNSEPKDGPKKKKLKTTTESTEKKIPKIKNDSALKSGNKDFKAKKKFQKDPTGPKGKFKKEAGKGDKKVKNEEKKENEPKDKKEERKKQKQKRLERKKKAREENVFELGVEAKKIWEKVRREDCPEEEKESLLKDLHSSVKGNVKKLIFAHDTVRVIECLMALGSEEIRQALFEEMKEDIINMTKSQYAHFFTVKLLKYGTKEQRAAVMKAFQGKVADLMKHKIANTVVEECYNEYANAAQRNHMLQEFCGPEFKHFKEDNIRTIAELIKAHPDKERDIVKHLNTNIGVLITKGCYNHSLVHTVIYNYMQVCPEKERAEVIEQLRDACVHVLHSHDGSRLSMMCIWHGTTKDRKAIIKSFKTFVPKIAMEKHGHMVLLAIFDAVDDTKLVGKAIVGEIIANMADIAANEFGRKVLMYLLAPRNTTFFHPQVIDILKEGDGNSHSKKDSSLRASELREVITPAIAAYATENMAALLADNKSTVFLSAVLNNAKPGQELTMAMTSLAEEVCKPFAEEEENVVENAACHMMLKKIIAQDKVRHGKSEGLFCQLLATAMDADTLTSWIGCNRGIFLIVNMIETDIPEIKALITEKLKPLAKAIKKQKSKGAEILQKKLKWKCVNCFQSDTQEKPRKVSVSVKVEIN